MIKACVLGMPVSQSLSPKLHGYWLQKYGIEGSYTAMATPSAAIKDALSRLRDQGYAGCNLTIPLKECALPEMDEHDESCLMSGAINTVVIRDGIMTGYNSDGFGFVESLAAQAPDYDGKTVAILGTGGASRGIIASLRAAGAQHFILINRTIEKAELVKQQFKLNADIVAWDHRADVLKDVSLLVNCTSLGMNGQEPLDLSLQNLPDNATVCDIVYRPLETPLLNAAKARGLKIVTGLPMLLHQGRLGFDHWFGKDPEVTTELYEMMAKEAS